MAAENRSFSDTMGTSLEDFFNSLNMPRNSPCGCGSGKRFKHCHGASTFQDVIRKMREKNRRDVKLLKTYTQGFGRPIIYDVFDGNVAILIGNRLFLIKESISFHHVLMEYVISLFSIEWFNLENIKHNPHPLVRWCNDLKALWNKNSKIKKPVVLGKIPNSASAFIRLSYALYLIEHNDRLDLKLIERLKDADQFEPAAYEAMIYAAFALAGSKAKFVKGAEKSIPEFTAIFKNGKQYSVEVKTKQKWNNLPKQSIDNFKYELKEWFRRRLISCDKKRISNPIYCFELNIPELDAITLQNVVYPHVFDILIKSSNIKIDGKPIDPAYIIITNHSLNKANELFSQNFTMLGAVNMNNFAMGENSDIESFLEGHDEHLDVNWVMHCNGLLNNVPVSFDGTPPQALLSEHEGKPFRKIGQYLEGKFTNDLLFQGKLIDISSAGEQALVTIDCNGKLESGMINLHPLEIEAAAVYGDVIFGKPVEKTEGLQEPSDAYEWTKEICRSLSRAQLLAQIHDHPLIREYESLSDDALIVRVAREMAKPIIADMHENGYRHELQRFKTAR